MAKVFGAYAFLTSNFAQRELPQHTVLLLIEAIRRIRDPPKARVLPATRGEFEKERNRVTRFDGGEHRAVAGRQGLVAAPAFARVDDGFGCGIVGVRVARVDLPEIREQRDEATVAMVKTAPAAMRAMHVRPRHFLCARRKSLFRRH